MRAFLIACIALAFLSAVRGTKNFHSFTVKDINGDDFALSTLKGKKVLVVNTASECGYTPQYKELQELYEKYRDHGFTIVAFPANDFGSQEPGSNEQIKEFCTRNYGVTFPVMAKISVKGDDCHELYLWLTEKSRNGVSDATVKWNFNKFLIDENGGWISWFSSRTSPLSADITSLIAKK